MRTSPGCTVLKHASWFQAVKRNIDRFPEDFMFQLSKEELKNWRSQIVMSNPNAKMSLRRRPYAFTEHRSGDDGVGAAQ